MRAIGYSLVFTAISLVAANTSFAGDLIYGCMNRPTCGKYCKLVCESTKLTGIGYGCKCETICVPGRSKPGCKHCSTTCCGDTEIEGCPPKIEFCWYDWFTCGCARPRTVKMLTKYQAEQEICWYHWEVVDACEGGEETTDDNTDASLQFPHVYKAAPADALPGEVLPISAEERATLAAYLPAEQGGRLIQFASDADAALPTGNVPTTEPQSSDTMSANEEIAAQPADPKSNSLPRRLIDFFNR
jgi:hypothetical protein